MISVAWAWNDLTFANDGDGYGIIDGTVTGME